MMFGPVRKSIRRTFRRGAALATPLACLLVLAVAGQLAHALAQGDLQISASFAAEEAVAPDERITLLLSRALEPAEGTLVVFIGLTDVTSLFQAHEQALIYRHATLPLPGGESPLTVYLVTSAGNWKQLAQFPLRVRERQTKGQTSVSNDKGVAGRDAGVIEPAALPQAVPSVDGKRKVLGFETFEFKPSLTVNIKAQSAVLYFPNSARPDRLNFVDLSVQGSLQTNFARRGFGAQSQFDFVGTSFQREALRFGDQGEAAPQLDLSSYLTQFQFGKVKLALGHVSFGSNRFLINSFTSRGITATVPLGKRVDMSFAAMNGTSIVGWNNFLGLNQQKHKVFSGTLGYEFIPKRPGGLRLEVGVLRGSLLPVSNFNQSTITDAERSTGVGARIVARDSGGRFQLDAGYARSRFGNPADPLINQGFNTVVVRDSARDAIYADVTYQVLRDVSLTKEKKVNLSLAYRLNRVDPLFRSVAAFTQADRFTHQFEVTGNAGDIVAGYAHNSSSDNLDDIPSVLKTLNRRHALNIAAPVGSLLGDAWKRSPWLPRVSYNYDQTHAFAASVPINGGFETQLSFVPNQMSTNQSLNADWQHTRWRFGYRFNRSFQDNRQTGRELADLGNLVHTISGGVKPYRKLDVSLDLNVERAKNLETARLDKTLRAGMTFNWQTTNKSALTGSISTVFAGDAAQTSRSRNADLDLQWSMRFVAERDRYRKVQGQFFVRYTNRYASARDNIFLFNNLTRFQSASAGLSFTFF